MHLEQNPQQNRSQETRLPLGLVKEGNYYINEKDHSKMVLIPEGDFQMGVELEDIFARPHEQPKRDVFLSSYLIDIYPVTNEQYGRFMKENGYLKNSFWTEEGWDWRIDQNINQPLAWEEDGWDDPLQPVCGVSWYEAYAYSRWANKKLPSEAQWEKAARGTDGRKYPWGNEFPTTKKANFNNIIKKTTKVDKYPGGKSPFGCFDMAGNVNNWCEDWYWEGFYNYCAENGINSDPILDNHLMKKIGFDITENALKKGQLLKVDRGGGFATASECWEILSCTEKVAWPPYKQNYWNGFRTVIVL